MIINELKTMENQEGIMERLSSGFPISVYQTDFALKPYTPVSWHWHEDFQIVWVNSGTIRFHVVDQCYLLPANTGIFINCRLAHMSEPASPDASYFGVNFHPDVICTKTESQVYQQLLLPFIQSSASAVFVFGQHTANGSLFLQAFQRILSLSEQKERIGREFQIQGELLCIWPSIFQTGKNSKELISTAGNQRLKTILAYLHSHYAEKLTLPSIANQIHLSTGECSRFFKRVTGITVFEYLIQYRLTKSKELLSNTDKSIAEIAQETGFSSQSYYTVCFQKRENRTPNQYRRTVQGLRNHSLIC